MNLRVDVFRKTLQSLAVCVLTLFMLGAGTPDRTFDKLGHQLMCQCGCGQILLECNHVGCPVSGPMIEELKTQVALNGPSGAVLNWFVNKYGPVVLAAPIRGGFDNAAWIVPFAVFAIGLVAVVMLVRLWRQRHMAFSQSGTPQHEMPSTNDSVRARIRQETDLP